MAALWKERHSAIAKKELADLTAAVESSEKIFLYSERRLGKTSLVHTALRQLPKSRYASAYIDLWPTDGEAQLAQLSAQAERQGCEVLPA